MSNRSNNNGRAFELAYLKTLFAMLKKYNDVSIVKNSSYEANERAWNAITSTDRVMFQIAARSTFKKILELEPTLLEGDSEITLEFQDDSKGIVGDVRDIVLKKPEKNWEIGFSIKHRHEALKHSRIAKGLDFGKEWYGVPCSKEYWEKVTPVFAMLDEYKNQGKKWSSITNKAEKVYLPLLNAFIEEIKRANAKSGRNMTELAKYLIGKEDYYKIISRDNKLTTIVRAFNINGNLNKKGAAEESSIKVPKVKLPTELIDIRFKPKSKTTVELYLNNGWTFSFRIHSASTYCEPSLKFDVNYVGLPPEILSFNCDWV